MAAGQLGVEVLTRSEGYAVRLTPARREHWQSIVAIFGFKGDAEKYATGCKARLHELFWANQKLWDTPPAYRQRPSADLERIKNQIEVEVFGRLRT